MEKLSNKKSEDSKLAVGYCRVSTDEQANHGLSMDVQEKACTDALEHDGFSLLKVIRDEGKSAGTLNRSGIQEVIRLVVNQEVAAVYAISSDRLARNTYDHLYLMDLFRKNKVELKYVYQQTTDDSAMSRTMDTVMASFNEMQRLVTSEKVKKTLNAKASAGYFPGVAPLGYRNIDNPDPNTNRFARKIIVPDPIMGPLVTEAYKLYATGNYNGYNLNDLMYEKGLRSVNGKKLAYSRFYELFKNPIYMGELIWGDIKMEKAQHEPLIDRDTYNRVQEILGGHNKHACRRRKYFWLLSGFVYCPTHDKRFAGEWHLKKKLAYYHCTKIGCGKFVESVTLEDMIAEEFKQLEFNPLFVDKVIGKVKATFQDKRKNHDANRQRLINQKTAYEARMKVLEDKLLDQVIEDADFQKKRDEIKQELLSIQYQLDHLGETHEDRVDVVQEVLKLTKNIYATYQAATPELKRHYLSFFWERFEVKDAVLIKSRPGMVFRELLELQQAYLRNGEFEKTREYKEFSRVLISDEMLPN